MLQRSASTWPGNGSLIADAGDLPAARRRRARRTRTLASVGAGVLAVAAGGIAVIGLTSPPAIPSPVLTPIAAPVVSPTPEPTAPEDGIATAVLSGQDVWLAVPSVDPRGVAYLLPDAGADPEALLRDASSIALLADGWAVATGELAGLSWGSPSSTAALVELRAWVDAEVGDLAALYVGAGMGGTTALTSLVREPSIPVACWYAVAPVTDLVALVGAQPAIGGQITAAWGGIPPTDENPSLQAADVPLNALYRVVVPAAPQERVDDANAFLAALEGSGHEVTSVAATQNATVASLTGDLISFANGCSA